MSCHPLHQSGDPIMSLPSKLFQMGPILLQVSVPDSSLMSGPSSNLAHHVISQAHDWLPGFLTPHTLGLFNLPSSPP